MTILRVRSRDAPDPPGVDETALAAMAKVIADAQNEIGRLVQLGELQHDPIRHPIQALSVHLEALYQVTLASSQMLAHQLQASAQPADPLRQPARNDELRRAVIRDIADYADDALRASSRRSAVIGAGMLVAALLVGAAAGYWFHDRQQLVSAGQTECQDVDGGTLCRIPVWAKPPPATVAR